MSTCQERLSVIIPGYNTPREWWVRCINSVRKACNPDDEIICVDDGSEEKPLFLEAMAHEDTRIRVIFREVNGGPSLARNSGIEIAQGNFITFVDGDDEVCGKALRHSVDRLAENCGDIAFYGVKTIWDIDGLCKVDLPPDKYWGTLKPSDIRTISRMSLFNYPCNKVYARLFLVQHDIWFEPRHLQNGEGNAFIFCGEDCMFNLRCVMAGARWCSLMEIGYRYYRPRTTLLSTYKPYNVLGTKSVNAVWREYKRNTPGADEVLGKFGEIDERTLVRMEWKNLWSRGSPVGFYGKFSFLRENKSVFGNHPLLFLFWQYVFWWLRQYFYVRPVRRWNIRRMYPHVTEWTGET